MAVARGRHRWPPLTGTPGETPFRFRSLLARRPGLAMAVTAPVVVLVCGIAVVAGLPDTASRPPVSGSTWSPYPVVYPPDGPTSASPNPSSYVTPITATTPAVAPSVDVRYADCAKVIAAGLGPYRQGRDAEYAWYPDEDRDGWACERQAEHPGRTRYKDCDQVRAAGAAPLYRGDPGYNRHLDRDGDGVACD